MLTVAEVRTALDATCASLSASVLNDTQVQHNLARARQALALAETHGTQKMSALAERDPRVVPNYLLDEVALLDRAIEAARL